VMSDVGNRPIEGAKTEAGNAGLRPDRNDGGLGSWPIRRFGLAVMAATFIADQVTKQWLLMFANIIQEGPFPVTSFFELAVVWNRGVSYGLFQQSTDWGRWALITGSLLASSWMTAIMWRAPDRLTAASLALIVGGALGNAVDRVTYGAVFDFAHFFIGDWSWYVFNVADAAIVVGVFGLLYDAVAEGRWRSWS
jgi:signal peptidase II